MSDASVSRRTALTAGLTGAGALALAACGSSGSSTTPATSTPPTSGPAGTRAPDSASTGASSTAPAVQGLAQLDSITIGEAVSAQLGGRPVIVARPSATTAACFSAICTHMGCTVAPAGKQLRCPCHGSVYNATTGAVISGPAPRALDTIPVKVDAGEVVPSG